MASGIRGSSLFTEILRGRDGDPSTHRSLGPRILLVDDDPDIRRDYARVLRPLGEVITSCDGEEAIACLAECRVDAVLCDISMPRMTGVEFLRNVRLHDPDVPVILMTGEPGLGSAVDAVEYGAFRYLTKPIPIRSLTDTVRRALHLSQVAKLKREALALTGTEGRSLGDRAALEARYESGVSRLWMAYQPIVLYSDHTVFAYEALVRSEEPYLQTACDLLDAAERLGLVHELGRAIRRSVAEVGARTPEATFFVNLHPQDLQDADLYSPDGALTAIASRVVLEVTERASLEGVAGVGQRIALLREMGFRIAVDDLGAGYAGLNSFVQLEPDFVKLDMALIRGVDGSERKRRVVRALVRLCRQELGIEVICEGVETTAERDALLEEGGDLLQGFLYTRPDRPFPAPQW